ncbi:MAG TPA: DNA polymerase III subunit alpha [Abditibacteriaceae bacterium]|jgi:DNA polymerase III alpha subunit
MSEIPQLRVRTEFTFRYAYGKVDRVAQALRDMGAPAAGIVDGDTWGHVRFRKAMKDAGVRAMYGREVAVPHADGRMPVAWTLAEDIEAFYTFSSAATHSGTDIPKLFADARGVIRFAGAGLDDPACFDYVDVNPGSVLQQRRALELARRTGRPLVVTSDNAYPRPEDHRAFLAVIDRESLNPRPIMTTAELRAALSIMDDATFATAVANTREVAARCASELHNAPLIQVPGSLRELVELGRQARIGKGHIVQWTSEYSARLDRELALIESKKFDSYFIVVADMIQWAKERMLVGPARGSSAGSLVCYLLAITEVDPIAYGLLFERFIDVTRNDLPDIDIDFNHVKREAIFGYLSEKYGADCVARIGNIATLKAPSLLSRVCPKLGIAEHHRARLLDVTQFRELPGSAIFGKTIAHAIETTSVGQRFKELHPQIECVLPAENHADHTSVHAAGVIVCNVPVTKFCTVDDKGIAHLDKVDAEELNLLKMDALSIATLSVIEDAGVVTAEELYALKPNDPEVYKIIDSGKCVGVFQFDGGSMRKITSKVRVNEFRLIDHITALSRPGPLDSGATDVYIKRENGQEPDNFPHPSLEPILKSTHGIILYQEQVMRICREVAGFPWEDVSDIRRAIGKKKGNDYFDQRRAQFIEGAAKTVGMSADVALSVWQSMLTFGTYGFNQSHSVSYGIVSYWCAWMKRYHPLEFAAACLRAEDAPEKISEILRECQQQGIDFIAFDPDLSGMTWEVRDGKLVGGFMNIVGIGPSKAAKAIADRAAGTLKRERFENPTLRFAELFPLRRKYRDWYINPESFGCRDGTVIVTSNEFASSGWPEYVWLAQVVGKRNRDDNEQRLVDRRNGEVKSGGTQFLDIICRDDFGADIIVRIPPAVFEPLGRMAMENLRTGDVVLVRAKKVPEYNILRVVPWGLRCINRPDILDPQYAGAVFDDSGEVTILPPRTAGEPEPEPVEIVNGDY